LTLQKSAIAPLSLAFLLYPPLTTAFQSALLQNSSSFHAIFRIYPQCPASDHTLPSSSAPPFDAAVVVFVAPSDGHPDPLPKKRKNLSTKSAPSSALDNDDNVGTAAKKATKR
jgi:hypothetical protein